MDDGKMIVIGAGIGGMATGCYARMNGYDVDIFEMQGTPGGVCTSWDRKDYTLDYCIHNLPGTSPRSDINVIWRELGALRSGVIDHEEFVKVEDPSGKSLTFFSDCKLTKRSMLELSPEDRDLIEEFFRGIKKISKVEIFAAQLGGWRRTLRMIPLLGTLKKFGSVEVGEFAKGFKDPFLRKAVATVQYDIPEVPILIPFIFLSGLNHKDLGWPKGGSLAFAKEIEERFLGLGGRMHYRSKVEKVLVENDRAVGVRLVDGTEHRADVVVSNADGRTTIFDMLEGRYVNDMILDYYQKWVLQEMDFGLQVSFGVTRDLEAEPHAIVLFLERPITVEGKERDHLNLEIFSASTGLAPVGKGVVKVILKSNYQYWKDLKEKGGYAEEKHRLAETFLKELERRFPGIRGQVEVVDVATLLSVERFCGSHHGMQAWGARRDQSKVMKNGLSSTLPGLQNFYMVGQWAGASIGIATVAMMGRNLVKELCGRDGKTFITSVLQSDFSR